MPDLQTLNPYITASNKQTYFTKGVTGVGPGLQDSLVIPDISSSKIASLTEQWNGQNKTLSRSEENVNISRKSVYQLDKAHLRLIPSMLLLYFVFITFIKIIRKILIENLLGTRFCHKNRR